MSKWELFFIELAGVFVLAWLTWWVASWFTDSAGIMPQDKWGVALRLGKTYKKSVINPGVFHRMAGIITVRFVSKTIDTVELPPQRIPFEGYADITLGGVMNIQVFDPVLATVGLRDRQQDDQFGGVGITDYMQFAREVAEREMYAYLNGKHLDVIAKQGRQTQDAIRKLISERLEVFGIRVVLFSIATVDIPANLVASLTRKLQAEFDAQADQVRADNEDVLATKYIRAARSYLGENASDADVAARAFMLRGFATAEDAKAGGLLINAVDGLGGHRRSTPPPPPGSPLPAPSSAA